MKIIKWFGLIALMLISHGVQAELCFDCYDESPADVAEAASEERHERARGRSESQFCSWTDEEIAESQGISVDSAYDL